MILIFSAPSGSGKSTMVHHLMEAFPDTFELSISATTRAPRGEEVDGREYYFISVEEFEQLLREDAFVEHEQVYQGLYYGTLKREIERIQTAGHHVLFDVDVKGGMNLERYFGERAMSVFIAPPSIEELSRRLHGRGDTSEEMIQKRLAKAAIEMEDAKYFDHIIINDDLHRAQAELDKLVNERLVEQVERVEQVETKPAKLAKPAKPAKPAIGIYGGSFNPIHFGHIGLVRWVLEHTDLDEIWLMVTPNNPLKDSTILADENARLQAAREAVKDIPSVKVSDFEFSLPRPSYTANTLRELQKAYPDYHFVLLIGEDNWQVFDQWREHDFILSHFPIMVYPRRGATINPSIHHSINPSFLKDAPYFDISSTELRAQKK